MQLHGCKYMQPFGFTKYFLIFFFRQGLQDQAVPCFTITAQDQVKRQPGLVWIAALPGGQAWKAFERAAGIQSG
jgi:hypothetical protein